MIGLGVDTRVHRGHVPGMVVTENGRSPKQRRFIEVLGVGSKFQFGVHNNTLVNLRRGLVERVFYVERDGGLAPPPPPEPEVFERSLGGYRDKLVGMLGDSRPMSRDEFLLMRRPSKRKVYQQAIDSLSLRPVERKDAYMATFVKNEKINFTKKPDPAPRVIQPRTPRYNVEVGCMISHREHDIYECIDTIWGGRTVMKGYNARETGEAVAAAWSEFKDPVAIGLDAERFDQHCSVDALIFEHSTYLAMYSGRRLRKLARLLRWQLNNIGFGRASDGTIRYVRRGCRMSGDMNTALGNVLLVCLMGKRFVDELGLRARFLNNGDDCTLIFERCHLQVVVERLRPWFLRYGYSMKVEDPVFHLEGIEFCQMHPVWTVDGWVMVRNSLVALSKDAIITRFETPETVQKWMHMVGKAGQALTSGIPIHQAYYECFIRSGVQGGRMTEFEENEGFWRLARGLSAKHSEVHPQTRFSFYLAFGIVPDMQVALEDMYEQLVVPKCALPPGTPRYPIVDI